MRVRHEWKPNRKGFILVATFVFIVGVGGYMIGTLVNLQLPSSNRPAPDFSYIDAGWKTYINNDRLYSFQYPSEWEVIKEKPNENINIKSVVIRPHIAPCPSNVNPFTCETTQVIYVSVRDIAVHTSLTDYLNQVYGEFKPEYTRITIDGIEGLRTSDVPGQFNQEDIFVKNRTNIYQITWIKSQATTKITEEMFDNLRSTFSFDH